MMLEQLFQATDVRFDHHPDGFGIGTARPSLSWRYPSDAGSAPTQRWSQKSYLVERRRVGPAPGGLETDGPVVRSHVITDTTIMNQWPGPALRSREMALVRVAGANTTKDFSTGSQLLGGASGSTDADGLVEACGNSSNLSDIISNLKVARSGWAPVEAGLLDPSDWKAKFITSTDPPPPENVPHRPTVYRKTFTCDLGASYAYARLYISALGLYEAHINGQRVGDQHMAPGWTSYHHRVQYQTYDVTKMLKPGQNVISVEVAEGWYAGRLLWIPGLRNLYGDTPGFIAQLEIHSCAASSGGTSMAQIVSDDSWVCHPSPRQSASIYDGEVYDARGLLPSGDSAWQRTRALDFNFDQVRLVATDAPPVRITQVVKPINVFKSPSGKTLVDFGQNLVGRVQIQVPPKPRDHELTIRHAEVLERGELGIRPLRDAKATDKYIFSGEAAEQTQWAPIFTFHGFRYIELEGWSLDDDVPPSADNLSALVVGSDMKRTGHFSCSDEMVNKLHENVTWSMRGNFLSVPTDCPQRDERLGWTGDLQVFSPTASYLYASAGFLTNWLRDLSIDQEAQGGCVPVVIPDVLHGRSEPNDNPVAVWDDAAVLVPWTVYQWSGDAAMLRRQLPSMEAHLRQSVRRGPDGLWDDTLFQFGDWLDPNAPPEQADLARTDGTLVADAYLVHVTSVLARVSVAVGDAARARAYQAEFEALRARFGDKYVSAAGLVVSDSQTGLALALCFDLLGSAAQRRAAGDRLARLVRASQLKVSTGFAGTPLVLHALARAGHLDLAYGMLLCRACPSWLYPVTMGATTVWERWDSMLPDGSINPGSMTSFNHYALGSVADWLHTVVGGVRPLEAGLKTFAVRPRPGGGLTACEVSFEGPYGRIGCRWAVEAREADGVKVFKMRVEVPPNSRALVVLPGQEEEEGQWKGSGVCEMECEMAG